MNLVARENDPSVRIRFPKQVLKEVDAAAKRNGRSRNSEVVWRLAESLGVHAEAVSPAPAGQGR